MIEFLLGGSKHTIYFITTGSNILADYADDLKAAGEFAATIRGKKRLQSRPDRPKDWKKFVAVLKKTVQHGYKMMAKTNAVKTWMEAGPNGEDIEVAEIRKGQLRVFFFEDTCSAPGPPSRLILTHGYTKKTNSTPDGQTDCFINLRASYYTWLLSEE